MKILKISSAIPSFRTVAFNPNFSIILGVAKSLGVGKSHNLGKTTLISLIDHILFGSRDSDRIKAIKANFANPVFTVTLLIDGMKKDVVVDYTKKRKPIFDADVRQSYEYFLRFQDDYKDEFRKVSIRGKDSTWKPLILRLLGFNDRPLIEKYEIETAIAEYDSFLEIATSGNMQRARDESEIDRLNESKNSILESIETLDLSKAEDTASKQISQSHDKKIAELKKSLFITRKELASINEALHEHTFVEISPARIQEIYTELDIYFGDQLIRDLGDVQNFYEQISINRSTSLNRMKKQLTESITDTEAQLNILNSVRTRQMELVVSASSIDTYKALSLELARTESALASLTQDIYKESIMTAMKEKNILQTEQLGFAAAVGTEIDENDTKFREVQEHYAAIMLEVMDITAEIVIEKNSTGNLTFKTISWRDGKLSEELKGEMAKKISCAAFDVALRIVNNTDMGFVIHDGVIDGADTNIKQKFVDAMKRRANEFNFQYILAAISDDLPALASSDVVITLSDSTESELLFGKRF